MRREGRQHGTVRSCLILPPNMDTRPKSRVVNQINSPPVAGIFVKVPSKPTNHSKFTGKCCGKARCTASHVHPACKSRDKAKGTHKVKSKMGKVLGLRLAGGSSAAGILSLLADGHWDDEMDEREEEEEEEEVEDYPIQDEEEVVTCSAKEEAKQGNDHPRDVSVEEEEPERLRSIPTPVEETDMGFHDLGFVLDLMEDVEDWCLIGDI